jgi:GTP-binding protein HflX
VLSDTVGFISDLPHELVEAFRATLEEVQEADVILHVRDIANPDTEAQAGDVRDVLRQLEVGEDRRLLEVWNKIDLLPEEERGLTLARAKRVNEGSGFGVAPLSATTGEGTDELLRRIAELVDDAPTIEASVPPGEGEAVAWLYEHGRVVAREQEADGVVRLSVKLNEKAFGRFERLFPHAQVRQAAE